VRVLVANWQDRHNPSAGGAEIHLHEVFGRLAGKGHEITLLVSGWGKAAARTTSDGMRVHRVGSRHTYNLVAPLYYRNHLRAAAFDVFLEDLNKVPLFAPYWMDRPMGLLVHHLFGATAFTEAAPPIAAATWLLERPLPFVYRRVPTVAVSQSTLEDLVARGFDAAQIRVIENGIDLQHYAPDPAQRRFEQPTVLYLGRLKRYKRVDLVVRGFARVAAQRPRARLIIAGAGDVEAEIRRLVQRLGLASQVELRGFVSESEKLRLLRGTWVHVLTSPKEGWGISNLEAAACGTPTIASDSPGLRDSVQHGRTGLLVPHGDVTALSESMATILDDPGLRERLGAGALAFAQQFSWTRAAERMEEFLHWVAKHPTADRRVHEG
jgi:glycosyltransferase involved in cell wall biosynthesis